MKCSVTTQIFVTRRPHGAKPQVKGAQGPTGRPNPMAGQPHFESVRAGTWRLRSHISLEENPMPESRWKLGGLSGSSPLPLYKDPHGRIHTHHTLLVVLHL
jgi:hypothetical protein